MAHFNSALITGASSGIGAELARELSRRGTRVVLAARRADRLESLAAELRAAGGQAEVEVLDVVDTAAVREVVTRWDERLGGLDLVIANAGVGRAVTARRLTWEEVEPVLLVNVVGAMATLTCALERMRVRGRGTLCGISSLASRGGMPGSGAYSASKAALATFLETLTVDLAGTGLQVVDVQPGFVASEMTDHNDFHMPFKWNTPRAARRIVDDLERGRAICAFPWQLSVPLALTRGWPRALWRALARRARPA
ncbi:SDR family NAD(P)-dependent oxidoreductase [Engelhardtia mirabilis]|uniref:Gluconate 5-dehydrogenase n=1 Tax=Engelhardtia mirabilis TaxID=2528011 RepID=A0A518BN24_9BACT|nr:Gluconate 5-dehydrogenase [Planctomycetes bacterium Pla133]QDV02700.1 Gluconate 5-dehydrogenase [Planctomycetes bacterium Pla86]